MSERIRLNFDDEEAGGSASWSEWTVLGALPRAGDWVWSVRRRYVVDHLGWTFVQEGSPAARSGQWEPFIRIHVRPADTPGGET